MNRQEKLLLFMTVLAGILICADVIASGQRDRARFERNEAAAVIASQKDAVRDQWMKGHQSKIMERFEGGQCSD